MSLKKRLFLPLNVYRREQPLAYRLLIAIIIFSSFITLLGTSFQLYLDYRNDVNYIRNNLQQIQDSHLQGLINRVWDLDQEDIQTILNGILQLRDIRYLEIRTEEGEMIASAGSPSDGRTIEREYPLIYHYQDTRQFDLGVLKVTATMEGVYQRLREKVVVILVTQALKTFLVSSFILIIFHYLITRHLTVMARYAGKLNLKHLERVLSLDKKRTDSSNPDELEQVADAINKMRIRIMEGLSEREMAEEKIRRLNLELEQRVIERTAELEAANRELESFSYSVSHDLRAPLRHISGFINLLKKESGSSLNPKGEHHINVIADSARHMGRLIDHLLAFSQTGRQEMQRTRVNMEFLVNEVIQGFKEETAGRDIRWNISPLPEVYADRSMLSLAITNLVSNALKFTRTRETAEITIGTDMGDNGEVIFYIRDNGAGFDMKYKDKLYGVFQRLHRRDEFEGTGIGLANVHRIISRHGGRTWAEGWVDKGAVFSFSLPVFNKGSERI